MIIFDLEFPFKNKKEDPINKKKVWEILSDIPG
jgi:hypothetical protein